MSSIQVQCKTVRIIHSSYQIGYSLEKLSLLLFVCFQACVGIIPVGATVQLGANLHLIVPEGNCALPLTLIPTTVSIQRPPQPPPSVQLSQTLHPPQPANYTPAKVYFTLLFCSCFSLETLFCNPGFVYCNINF